MSFFSTISLSAAENVPNDGVGSTSLHPILPPIGEMIIGSLASIIVFSLIVKFAGPTIKKSMSDRTARIQKDLDDSAAAASAAEAEASKIRAAKGDIVDLETRAEAELVSAAGRSGDELRAEIARYSSGAIDSVVNGTLDDAAHQDLIESFIARVGSSTGAAS